MPTRLLIVVRHGRTEWNASRRFQGQADPPLDDVGAQQADECAIEVALALGRAGTTNPRILSSDLRRAADTATAIARTLGRTFEQDPRLREVDVGRWAGLTRAEAERRFPEEYRQWLAGCDIARGGGESVDQAGRRVADRIAPELASGEEDVLVVVGHGMALQNALGHLRRRGCVSFEGDPPHLGNGQWLGVAIPGSGPPPIT